MSWEFFIDVGGTFTDVVAHTPEGRLVTHKLLSTGAVRGSGRLAPDGRCILDPQRNEPPDFWKGYTLRLMGVERRGDAETRRRGEETDSIAKLPNYQITKSAPGELHLSEAIIGLISPGAGQSIDYELRSHEEAPVVAIRQLMGLRLDQPIGPILVRLGTTRATNALLERKGARVAFVTTKGFADVLKIGYQDRPELFKLHIQKRDELYEGAVEIDERLTADGRILRAPDPNCVRDQLSEIKQRGIAAVAICFLHAHINPAHEEEVAAIAESLGFEQVSVSSRLSRLERIVPRGDTTVLDAYLSGVIRSYVRSLQHSMSEARIQLMTSAGGLIDAASATGKDTILSGPAGGVIGCAHVSRAAGFGRAIGFDMGGTSTDVSRIEPPPIPFEYQHETVKAGVRVQTPVLAIETVAAGGGSICGFDGQKLTVGPQSAGADPGPACYGRGGPLTVTDVNLLLGRVVPGHFPFELDRQAAERRADELRQQVAAATGSRLSREEVAQGFLTIANANMVAAIRKVSIAKGYAPADYVLTTFGGAGAQHACAIARELGIRRILCNEYAGVLSALGIGVADLKRIEQRSVQLSLEEISLSRVQAIADELAASLQAQLLADGASTVSLDQRSCILELCYAGQSTLLPVPLGAVETMRESFEAQHQQLYGYRHAGRSIEIRIIRVELSANSAKPAVSKHSVKPALPIPSENPPFCDPIRTTCGAKDNIRTAPMIVAGEARQVPLFSRSELCTGQEIIGPAIVTEPTSTIIIDPGWRGEVLPTGDLLLLDTAFWSEASARHAERSEASPGLDRADRESVPRAGASGLDHRGQCRVSNRQSTFDDRQSPDPIQLELFNNQFAAVAEQMGTTLRRTALSTNVKERLDFSCAVFTPQGDLVVNAPHIPVHLGGMSDCVKCLMEDVGAFVPGDVYVTNDPYRGGSHLNDVTVVTPVHDECGANIIFFVASRAHHAEIGGKRPGSMPPDSTCLAEEGVLIRAFACVKGGRFRAEELRAVLAGQTPLSPPLARGEGIPDFYPSRSPDENLADISAQIAANQRGAADLQAMVARHGLEVVHAYMRHIQSAAERKARAAIRKLPGGIHEFTDYLDDGSPICLKVTIHGDEATFDFSGTGPVLRGNLNANRSIVTSAVLYCLRCLIDEDIPLNGGVLAPVRIILPECFLNPPRHDDPRQCPAVAGGNVETSQRVVDTIFGALRTVAASQGTMNNLLIGNERFGYYETICGGAGAGPTFDGADAVHTNMTNTRLTDPEVLESRYPMRLIRFQIREGSSGAGLHRGGDGVIREIEFLEPLEVSIISQRRSRPPYGLLGGAPGSAGHNTLLRVEASGVIPITKLPNYQITKSEESTIDPGAPGSALRSDNRQSTIQELPGIATFSALLGDRLIIETPGGGGWGSGPGRNEQR